MLNNKWHRSGTSLQAKQFVYLNKDRFCDEDWLAGYIQAPPNPVAAVTVCSEVDEILLHVHCGVGVL